MALEFSVEEEMELTKSDFLSYSQCQKQLWLFKKKPEAVTRPAPSAFERMLMADGYAVEAEVIRLVARWPDGNQCRFQAEFRTEDGLYARADLIRPTSDGRFDLFEIKASTSVKDSTLQSHIIDAAFQTLVAEASGFSVRSANIIHLNKDYCRKGDINPESLLTITDVTETVRERMSEIEEATTAALDLLSMSEIDERGCDCRFKGRSGHCATFSYFNPDVPPLSIYDFPRISGAKLNAFVNDGRISLDQIDPSEVTPLQLPVLLAAMKGEPVVNRSEIERFIAALKWPLYFIDYETFGSAIPIAAGMRPYEQLPVQYSLDRLSENGALDHFEYLSERPGQQLELITQLEAETGLVGNLVSWNKSFEGGCNERMAERFPDKTLFLRQLNDRTVDLMDVFKRDYVDSRFGGSTSIKNVLPVLCPELRYDEDGVHDGAGAMEAWICMVNSVDPAERDRIAEELKGYCGVDTLAMVEIFQFLRGELSL